MKQKDLEAALAALPPGRHSLYIVTPPLWARALAEKGTDPSAPFNPIRVKKNLQL